MPAGATAVILNVTVTNPTAAGFVVARADGSSRPPSSNVNFRPGQTQANEVVIPLPTSRRVVLRVDSASANLVADLVGWATDLPTAGAGQITTLAGPVRLVDSRTTSRARVSGELPVDVNGSVPAEAVGVVLNVTLTGATQRGFAVVYPTGSARPATSNVNTEPRQTQANEVISRIGRDGRVSVYVDSTAAGVVVDLVGYLLPAGTGGDGFTALALPVRTVDSRTGLGTAAGKKTGNTAFTLPDAVPAGATAVLLNVTATRGTAPGFVAAFPTGGRRPATSNVNFGTGTTQANEVLARIGAGRQVTLFVGGAGGPSTDLVVDVVGYVVPTG